MLTTKHILKNGIRVLLTSMEGTEAVTVMILVKAGSRCEDVLTNGLAHFQEHMFFKGGKKYPSTKAVAVAADSMGAEYNAFTSSQEVAYYMQCAGSQVEKALDILSDMLFETQFKQEDVEKERGVVLEEINRKLDDPGHQVWTDWRGLIFGNQPLGRPILGPPDNIKKFNSKDFLRYRQWFYATDRIVVSIAGKINDKALKLVEQYFGAQKSSTGDEWKLFDSRLCTDNVQIRTKDTAQAHFVLGVLAPEDKSDLAPAARLLAMALGGGMSSRLFLRIREKQGLCYSVGTHYERLYDIGSFAIYAGVKLEKTLHAVAGIIKECGKVFRDGITKAELKKVKAMLEGTFALGLENSQSVAMFYGKQELLHDKMDSPREVLDKIQAVTLHDVAHIAYSILNPKRLCITVVGPYEKKSDFSELLHY